MLKSLLLVIFLSILVLGPNWAYSGVSTPTHSPSQLGTSEASPSPLGFDDLEAESKGLGLWRLKMRTHHKLSTPTPRLAKGPSQNSILK